jgi:hypothetical protein
MAGERDKRRSKVKKSMKRRNPKGSKKARNKYMPL